MPVGRLCNCLEAVVKDKELFGGKTTQASLEIIEISIVNLDKPTYIYLLCLIEQDNIPSTYLIYF